MPTRTLTASLPGPAAVDIVLGVDTVVTLQPTAESVARITVHTDAVSGPAADAVRTAALHADGEVLAVIVQGAGQSASGDIHGGLVFARSTLHINRPSTTDQPVTIDVAAPAGSTLTVSTATSRVTVSGTARLETIGGALLATAHNATAVSFA